MGTHQKKTCAKSIKINMSNFSFTFHVIYSIIFLSGVLLIFVMIIQFTQFFKNSGFRFIGNKLEILTFIHLG